MKSSGFCISSTAALPSKLACSISPKQNVRLPLTHTTTFLLRVAEFKKSDHTVSKILTTVTRKELGEGKREIKLEILKIGLSLSLSLSLPLSLPLSLSLRSYNNTLYDY